MIARGAPLEPVASERRVFVSEVVFAECKIMDYYRAFDLERHRPMHCLQLTSLISLIWPLQSQIH